MKKSYILFLSFAFLVISLNAQLNLPIYEPFALNLGTLTPQNTWTGTAGVGNGAQVVDSNLTYVGLANTSALFPSYAVKVGNQTGGAIQQLVFTAQNTKTYASYLIRLSAMPPALIAGSYYVTMGNGQTPGGTMYAIPNANGTTFELGFNTVAAVPTSQNTTNQNFTLGQTIMVVMAFTPATTANNGTGTLSVWINPSSSDIAIGANEPTPTFTGITGGNLANVANVFIRSGTNTRSMIFDELRIGKNWSEVTTYSTVLPVSLADFTLTKSRNITNLSWTSNEETNFSEYVVLFSNNGIDFNEIGIVAAKGSNTQYSFNYAHTASGYFKLKMLDKDGRFTYSNILYAAGTKPLSIQISPNPVTDKMYVTGMPDGKNTVDVFNVLGVRIKSQIVENTILTMPLSELPAGTYFVNISNNGNRIFSTTISK